MCPALSPPDAIRHFLRSLRKPARLLVAISGGSDSTGLLVLLHRALADENISEVSLTAATVDHGLRPGSADEARQVENLCHTLGIEHVTRRWAGEKPQTGLSAAAREARYALLAEAAAELDADLIVSGHTRDDQIETVAMRATRSDHPASTGLSGMAAATLYDRRFWIMRPLLACRRDDIRTCLRDADYGWIDDPSNQDPRYERVRTRKALMSEEGPDLARDAAERREHRSVKAASFLSRHASAHGNAVVRIDPEALACGPDAVRYALSALLAVIGGRSHLPGRETMDRVMAFVDAGQSGRMTAARVLVVRRRDGLFLMREHRDILPLPVAPGEAILWDGRFHIRNTGDRNLLIKADATDAIPPELADLPEPIARHAARVLPRIAGKPELSGTAGHSGTNYDCEIALGPYDRYLPLFDIDMANALAALFARPLYLAPPV